MTSQKEETVDEVLDDYEESLFDLIAGVPVLWFAGADEDSEPHIVRGID